MDIEYLLLLQNFRNAIGDALTPFLETASLFAITLLVVVPAFVYWCVGKREGLFALAAWSMTCAVNSAIKLTACVYRPWIRDPRILPAGNAIATAGGYSFPSGHTATAGPLYGSFALQTWNKARPVAWICVALILVTGFSRNYLGVHTPQDVVVALVESALALFATCRLFDWLSRHPERENAVLLAGFAAGWALLAYVTFKPYHVDVVDGAILVDPRRMTIDAYGDIGQLICFCVARFVDRTWIRFKPVFDRRTVAWGIAGAVILCIAINMGGHGPSDAPVAAQQWGKFVQRGAMIFFVMVFWPLMMKLGIRDQESGIRESK